MVSPELALGTSERERNAQRLGTRDLLNIATWSERSEAKQREERHCGWELAII